ncbi:hypothetical protein HOY82DRAFT_581032 [Tuber indicum]|nr:hypothetical protein HOY82DRAFT_581032 [Tuber indicum]
MYYQILELSKTGSRQTNCAATTERDLFSIPVFVFLLTFLLSFSWLNKSPITSTSPLLFIHSLSLTLLSSPHRLPPSPETPITNHTFYYSLSSDHTNNLDSLPRLWLLPVFGTRQGWWLNLFTSNLLSFTKLRGGSVLVSWGLFLAIAFAGYWWYGGSRKVQPHGKRIISAASEKLSGGSVFVSSGTDGNAAEKKKKSKKKKAALSNTCTKKVASIEGGEKVAQSTDDDAAQDEDELQALRRLQSLTEGGGKKGALSGSPANQSQSQKSQLQKPYLTTPASPFATASQTSSTGADADIDEEETSQLPGPGFQQSTSSDPSDMLEESTTGARILTITPSTQPPRTQKQRSTTPAIQSGTHANKNAKKKEKKKLEKEAERADQKARFEQHRASVRAAEVAKQKSKLPSDDPMVGSAWITVNGKRSSTPTNAPEANPASGDLLDTFVSPDPHARTQHISVDSEEDENLAKCLDPTHRQDINDSLWETVPAYLAADWSEVQRKGRKQKKAINNPDTGKSGDESASVESTKVSQQPNPGRPTFSKEGLKKETSKAMANESTKAGNGSQLLDAGSTTSDTKNSSSDWAEVDDSDNWAVHTES